MLLSDAALIGIQEIVRPGHCGRRRIEPEPYTVVIPLACSMGEMFPKSRTNKMGINTKS
jgi:hypothetical protein